MTARIAICGAGLIGAAHARIAAAEGTLAAIADPSPAAGALAAALGVPRHGALDALIAAERPDGVVVATPNRRHEADGMACVRAGLPVLIEKPLAESAAAAERLVGAAEAAGVPILTGHHRRYNPLVVAAKAALDEGRIGDLVAVNALCWLAKPADYFDAAWRRRPGAGPILINLIHDVELLIHLCGEIETVQAAASSAVRGFEVEDTAAAILRFANGALGTISVSDAAASPFSWELTAAENPAYPATGGAAYALAGTRGTLTIPDLSLWSYDVAPNWKTPIRRDALTVEPADPLIMQMRHFAEVAAGRAAPAVTGVDGLRAVRAIEAIRKAAETGRIVEP